MKRELLNRILNMEIFDMFTVEQKRKIAGEIQESLRATNNPELPKGEIQFTIHVWGSTPISWADIVNNGQIPNPEPDDET